MLNKEKIVDLYKEGVEIKEIANALEIRPQTVRKVLKEAGYSIKLRHGVRELNIEKAKEDLEKGVSIKEMALKRSMSQTTLRNLLKEHNLLTPYQNSLIPLPSKEELIHQLETEGGLKGCHAKYNMNYAAFRRRVILMGIKPSGSLRSPRKRTLKKRGIKTEDVVKAYQSGKTTRQVGEMFGLSRQGVCNRLEEAGVSRRKKGYPDDTHSFDVEKALELHHQGDTALEIAEKCETNRANIYGLLKKNDLTPNRPSKKIDVEAMWEDYQTQTLKEMEDIYGVCGMTIRRYLMKAGYKLRSRGTKLKK